MNTSRGSAPVSATKKKAPAKKKAASKPASTTKALAKAPVKKKAAASHAARADFGSPIAGFFEKQPVQMRPIAVALRDLVESVAPDAASSLKWGMPCYSLQGGMMCAIGGHKSHVNLILAGPPGTFDDPDGLLEGDGKTGRRLKLTQLSDLPKAKVRSWLQAAAKVARSK